MSEFKLTLKRSFDGWCEVGGVKFKLKYPTINQGKKMERMAALPLKYKISGAGENTKMVITDIDTPAMLDYKRYCVRCWIEGWEGMTENGQPVMCELKDDPEGGKYLEESLWWALVSDIDMLNILFNAFEKELGFTEADKKNSLRLPP